MFSRIQWVSALNSTLSLRLKSPVHGHAGPCNERAPALFSSGLAGDGIWLELRENQILAPFSGQFSRSNATGQQLCWRHSSGLVMQLDFPDFTKERMGQGFVWSVPQQTSVVAGQQMALFDLGLLTLGPNPLGVMLKLHPHPKINRIYCRAGYHQAYSDDLLALQLSS
ncbi:PTS glucose transporter subunit IIA [Rheinheimera marina]|uniref:PTS glucose transporter subunit IIA n=1 Tax=Rheinheimera marina TaxID=1774958 RepID=A0ABV9JQZ8_9GAMM